MRSAPGQEKDQSVRKWICCKSIYRKKIVLKTQTQCLPWLHDFKIVNNKKTNFKSFVKIEATIL